jgi:aspartate 1-decarboxylase
MFLTMFKSKVHRATVTEANLNYMGSITIDQDLLEAANILPNEKVQVVNINNGSRLSTYVIGGEQGSGVVCLNGAAARLAQPGDVVIIISYAMMTPEEANSFKPTIVMVDSENRITEVRHMENALEKV